MSSPVEYLFAATVAIANQAARERGWRPCARASWLKADGTVVHFICFKKQLVAVLDGAKVHCAA